MKDLFTTPDQIPAPVLSVFDSYDKGDEFSYEELECILEELKPLGYTFDYYLDAVPYNLRKINQ